MADDDSDSSVDLGSLTKGQEESRIPAGPLRGLKKGDAASSKRLAEFFESTFVQFVEQHEGRLAWYRYLDKRNKPAVVIGFPEDQIEGDILLGIQQSFLKMGLCAVLKDDEKKGTRGMILYPNPKERDEDMPPKWWEALKAIERILPDGKRIPAPGKTVRELWQIENIWKEYKGIGHSVSMR